MILRAAAVLFCMAQGASAQTSDDVAQAVQNWLTDHSAHGVIAIKSPDAVLEVVDLGLPADQAVELASLSKAITAICTATLVDEGVLSWADPVSDYVDGFKDITIADLVTHQSGVVLDATQTYMSAWLGDPQHRAPDVVAEMRKRGAPTGPQGNYAYSNDNYALLALVIEAAAQQSYQDTCQTRALAPAGVTAVPSGQSGAFLAWGGWTMRVGDYLRFHDHWFDTAQADFQGPKAAIGGGAVYGLGMLSRTMQGGSNYWHFGALCFPGGLNAGSFAVAFHNAWRVVVAYDRCVDWPDMVELDAAIVKAIFPDL